MLLARDLRSELPAGWPTHSSAAARCTDNLFTSLIYVLPLDCAAACKRIRDTMDKIDIAPDGYQIMKMTLCLCQSSRKLAVRALQSRAPFVDRALSQTILLLPAAAIETNSER